MREFGAAVSDRMAPFGCHSIPRHVSAEALAEEDPGQGRAYPAFQQ